MAYVWRFSIPVLGAAAFASRVLRAQLGGGRAYPSHSRPPISEGHIRPEATVVTRHVQALWHL